MSKRETLLKNVKEHGLMFPSRHRFVLFYKEGKFGIMTQDQKSKIKLENEKVKSNLTFFLDGTPAALLDVKDIKNAEEYVDELIALYKKWGLI